MMSDIALMLEEIRNKLDKLDHKIDELNVFPSPQMVWTDNSFIFNRTAEMAELEEIKAEPPEKILHQITKDEYREDSRYAKIEIIYYEVNGVFATLDDKLVEYLDEEYFGIDNLNLFGTKEASLDGKSDLYEIFLRDEFIHTDYHMLYDGFINYFAEHEGE